MMVFRTQAMSGMILALAGVLALIGCSLTTPGHHSSNPSKSPIFREVQDFTDEQVATSTALPKAQSSGVEVKSNDGDSPRGSVEASDRIMKELKAIYKSDSYKSGAIKIELIDDDLYRWDIRMPILDDECGLYKSMQELKNNGKDDHIKFKVVFNDQYPMEPPVVRVIYPQLHARGFSLYQGVPCLEILARSGWNPRYSMEALMLAVVDAFVTASKVVSVGVKGHNYDEKLIDEDAQKIMDWIAEFHGWNSSKRMID